MNLAEEFTRLHEAWNSAGVTEAPRSRHAFAVFCHENSAVIETGLYCVAWLSARQNDFDVFDGERANFEIWIGMNNKDGGPHVLAEATEGGYRNPTIQAAWLAWNARASGEPLPAHSFHKKPPAGTWATHLHSGLPSNSYCPLCERDRISRTLSKETI